MPHRKRRDERPTTGNGRRAGAAAVLLAFVFGSAAAFAGTGDERQGTIEFSYGRYNMADPLFKTVYQPGGAIQDLGLTAHLISYLDFYLDVKLMSKKGELSYSKEKTTLALLPISMGVRGSYPVAFVEPFAGLGLDTYIFYENNAIGTTVNHATGWHVQGGFYIRFGKSIPLLPFAKIKYTMVKSTINGLTVDLGGLEYGAGLAIAF
ncbi:MAG: hypothetical protein ACYDH3_04985 [Candidatus Aminicenantales bacterium]